MILLLKEFFLTGTGGRGRCNNEASHYTNSTGQCQGGKRRLAIAAKMENMGGGTTRVHDR